MCYQYWPNDEMALELHDKEFSIEVLMTNQYDDYIERVLSTVDKVNIIDGAIACIYLGTQLISLYSLANLSR